MKKTIKQTLFPLTAILALSGCNNFDETTPNAPSEGVRVNLYADVADDQTRAGITDDGTSFTGFWEQGDALGVISTAPSATNPVLGAFTYDGSAFTGTLPSETKGAWSYMAFYPHTNATGASVTLPFGDSRTQQGNTFNSSYDALVADVMTYMNAEPGKDDQGDPVMFALHRLTSILKFEISGGAQTDKVKAVLLSSGNEEQLLSAANLIFDASEGAAAQVALDQTDRSSVIAITFAEGTAPSVSDISAYFNIPEGNYDALTLDVITETNHIASATITRSNTSSPFVAGKLYKYQRLGGGLTLNPVTIPSFAWENQDIDAVHEITVDENNQLTYSAAIDITVPGGIAGLEVDITSAALSPLGITHLDLITEKALPGLGIGYNDLGLKCGTQIRYRKATTFDITALVPMITLLPNAIGDHIFTVTVTDMAGQTTTQALKFHYGQVAVNSTDLWKNTASLTINPTAPASTVVLEYKRSTASAWQQATVTENGDGTYTASIAPSWIDTTNAANTAARVLDAQTGIFAGATYDLRLTLDGAEAETQQFTAAAGNTFTDGSLETSWKDDKQFVGGSSNYTFWGSGYNSFAKELCTRNETMEGRDGMYCAKLTASYNTTFGVNIPAPGNLFTANFKISMSPMGGYVKFGKKYTYNARPSAVKVKVHATIGDVTHNIYGGPLAVGEPDKGLISVCIVDWASQREVFAGKSAPMNTWNPTVDKTLDQGPIVGYATKYITSTVGSAMEEIVIPICYNEDTAAVPTGDYNIVVNCSTSAFGDFMNACTSNVMYLDDFQWVY